MKICFKCGLSKSIGSFYENERMADGHVNKCIDCTKLDVKKRQDELRKNPDWVEKQRERGREKYHRLGYKNKSVSNDVASKRQINYRLKFPEKYEAKKISIKNKKINRFDLNLLN